MTTNRELWDALFPVVEVLVALGAPYAVSPTDSGMTSRACCGCRHRVSTLPTSGGGRPNWELPYSCTVLWMRLVWKAADVPACHLNGVPDGRTCTSYMDDIQFQHGCGHSYNTHACRRWSVEGEYTHGRLSPSGDF